MVFCVVAVLSETQGPDACALGSLGKSNKVISRGSPNLSQALGSSLVLLVWC